MNIEFDDGYEALREKDRLNRVEGKDRYYVCGGIEKPYRIIERQPLDQTFLRWKRAFYLEQGWRRENR